MSADAVLWSLSHGWSGLAAGYGVVQAPMFAALLRARSPVRRLLASPLLAVTVTTAAGAAMTGVGPLLHAVGWTPSTLSQLVLGATCCAGLGYTGGLALARSVPLTSSPAGDYRRGALVLETARGRYAGARPRGRGGRAVVRGADGPLTLAGLSVPHSDEAKHFKLIGSTGTGKSTAMRELLAGALAREDRAVIADPDGGYLREFYDPARGDMILNPFDERSRRWDLFAEIRNRYDVEQLARALIPDQGGAERSWRAYARTFFTAVTRQVHEAGVTEPAELYRLLVVAGTAELRTLVGGTPAQPFLEEHNGRMFDSIRSVTSSAVGVLEHIAAQRSAPLSVRAWTDPTRSRRGAVLFLPYQAGQIAALRTAISAWMRLAIFEAMDHGGQDQRLWFVLDELDALGPIDGLKDALARVRKFGGRCVLGFQSIAQVAGAYGEGDAHTIVENCGNTLILRCSASEGGGTSRFASQLIGHREVLRRTRSHSRRFSDPLGSITHSEHLSIEPAVMDSEIEQLPDLQGYLKFASREHWVHVQCPLRNEHEARGSGRSSVDSAMPPAPRPVARVRQARLEEQRLSTEEFVHER